MTTPTGLAATLDRIARDLDAPRRIDETLDEIVRSALATVVNADHAGISVTVHRSVTSMIPSDDLVRAADRWQEVLLDGPCVGSRRGGPLVRVDDFASEGRWPRFAPRALGLGMQSMLSFQLFASRHRFGALNIYSRVPAAFGRASERVGAMFAAHATSTLRGTG